jgi:putative redox protein
MKGIRGEMMIQTSVQWISGQNFVGVDSTRHSVILSAEDQGIGVKPSEMLLVALSSCTAVDVVGILEKKRKPLSFLEIITTGEKDAEPPWPYRKINLHYRLQGETLTEIAVEQAIRLSHEKYCSVAATVRGVAQITTSFEILPTKG